MNPSSIALLQTEDERAAAPPLSPKDRLGWLCARGHVTDGQRAAGDVLMKMRERKLRDGYATASGGGGGSLHPLEAREQARRRYERAMAAVTPFGEAIIEAVVIDGLSNEAAAVRMGIHPKAIGPLLRLALEVLAQHLRVPA